MKNKPIKVKVKESKKQEDGIIVDYKPNRITLYIMLLNTGRLEDLNEVLHKDMEVFKNEIKITAEEQAEAENVSEETILSNKVNRLKEMGYKITKEGDYND